mgnify:CR=1 FL=1
MIIWRAGYQVGGATEEVVTVLGSPDKDVQFGAAIAATDDDGAAPDRRSGSSSISTRIVTILRATGVRLLSIPSRRAVAESSNS